MTRHPSLARRLAIAAILGIVVSIPATVAATVAYLRLYDVSATLDDLVVLPIYVAVATMPVCGPFAAVVGILVGLVHRHIGAVATVLLGGAGAAGGGALAGWLLFANIRDIPRGPALELLALAWGVTAVIVLSPVVSRHTAA